MKWLLSIALALRLLTGGARAAEVAGESFPETRVVSGTSLLLNGAGVRLYSVFRVPVYAAALYLERRVRGDAAAVLRSPEAKLVELHPLRAVGADDIRDAWRESFAANCRPPCRMPMEAEAFLQAVRPSVVGSVQLYSLGSRGVQVSVGGQTTGHYGPDFSQLLLSTFIGASPPTEALKRALLNAPP